MDRFLLVVTPVSGEPPSPNGVRRGVHRAHGELMARQWPLMSVSVLVLVLGLSALAMGVLPTSIAPLGIQIIAGRSTGGGVRRG